METTNPATEVEAQAPAKADLSPEDRLEALFSGKTKQPAQEAKAGESEAEDNDEAEDAEGEETTEETAAEGQAETEGESKADETAEIEIDGETYVMPKKLKDAFLKSKDYTQKTQELATQRKVVEEQARFLEESKKLQGAVFEKAVSLKAIDAQLERYAALDWDALAMDQSEEGRTQYLRLERAQRALEKQQAQGRVDLQSDITKQQELSASERQQILKRGAEELSREIKGWSPDLGKKIMSSSTHYGFTEAELAEVIDSRYVRVLHDAHKWRELQTAKNSGLIQKKVEHAKPVTVKAARSAQTNQQAQLADASRARLKKTGNAKDAEDALFRLFDSKRKR